MINGKAIVLKWNVVKFEQFLLINLTDAEYMYASVYGSFSRKLMPSCPLLHLRYDTPLKVSTQMGKNIWKKKPQKTVIWKIALQMETWLFDFSN